MTQMPTDFFGEDLLDDFVERARTALCTLEDALDEQTEASFAQFQRDLHSLKGNAGTYGLRDVETLCHRFEDELVGQESWSNTLTAQASVFLAHLGVLVEGLTGGS